MLDNPARRRAISFMAAATGLGGCGMVSQSPFFSTIATFNRSPTLPVTPEKVDAIPYASLIAWFDGSSRALLVLGEYQPDNRLVWYSAEHQAMTTWGPYVLTLVGTEVGLYSTTLNGAWTADLRSMIGRRVGRTLNYQAPTNRQSVVSISRFKSEGMTTVNLLREKRVLQHIRENVTANGWHNYVNDYWIDAATGDCLMSRQSVIPTMPKLNIMIAKKPKGPTSV